LPNSLHTQGIAFEEYGVTWESDLREFIWVCEIEESWRDVHPTGKFV